MNAPTAHQPSDGSTTLRGRVVDQSALHGVLARLRDLGVPLVSLTQVPADQQPSAQSSATPTVQK